MPAYSTEQFTGANFTPSATAASATRVWIVINAVTATEALNATPDPASSPPKPIAVIGQSHPENGALLCTSLPCDPLGMKSWLVRAIYGSPSITGIPTQPGDPLTWQPRIGWRTESRDEPFDVDLDGRPVVNSAGDAYDPPPTRPIYSDILVIRKHRSFYDYTQARLYRGAVNSNNFVTGGVTFLAGECLCLSIAPTSEYLPTDTLIEIGYEFAIDTGIRFKDGTQLDSSEPFQVHLRDRGRYGFATITGAGTRKVPLIDGQGDPYAVDVQLDGTGKPVDTTVRVYGTGTTPQTNPNPPSLVASPFSTATNKIFKFRRHRALDFSALGL